MTILTTVIEEPFKANVGYFKIFDKQSANKDSIKAQFKFN